MKVWHRVSFPRVDGTFDTEKGPLSAMFQDETDAKNFAEMVTKQRGWSYTETEPKDPNTDMQTLVAKGLYRDAHGSDAGWDDLLPWDREGYMSDAGTFVEILRELVEGGSPALRLLIDRVKREG
jgi:hypothetical protein